MRPASRLRWVAPYFGVFFLALHVAVGLVRGGVALEDPSTGWHLAAGRLILQTGAIPRTDVFSYTAAGREWLDYYWLFQVTSAWLERMGGLPLFATVWMLVYGLVPVVLYRTMARRGVSPLAIFVVLPVAYMVLVSHALARPHAVTYLFFALLVGGLTELRAGRRTVRTLWWWPLMAVVWVNMHGGFVAGLMAVAGAGGGSAAVWLLHRNPADGRYARICAGLLVAMGVATIVNPYGYHLHVQALEHLRMPSTGLFDEFRSPDFRSGALMAGYFELLILGVLAVTGVGLLELDAAECALLVGTLHGALGSVRNMSLFAIVAAPVVADGLSRALARWRPGIAARWAAVAAQQERVAAWRVQVPAIGAVMIALAMAGVLPFPSTLDGLQLSRGAVAHIEAHPERFARAFNTIGLGGPLIYRFWPGLRVFVDDRTVVYGEPFIAHDYMTVLLGDAQWQGVLDRWSVTSAIVSTWAPCAERLRQSSAWRIDYEDAAIVLFVRTGASGQGPGTASGA